MKKYLIIAIAAFIALPLLNSCGPKGDPKSDAETIADLYEKAQDLRIDILEKELEMAEYYAENNDYKGYKKFLEKQSKLREKVDKDFKKEHKDEFKDLEKRLEKAEKKIRKKDKDDD
ncbi:MAG: hypothetical protein IKW85_12145 [Muribaculaceae bacterium]|nr:hypothetical protein [Muribaculaceae bacterium]